MINNHMDSEKPEQQEQQEAAPKKPNESTGLYVRGFVKISDPESGEVILETAS